MDWREKNVVTPVKNQGACGSCWVSATLQALPGVGGDMLVQKCAGCALMWHVVQLVILHGVCHVCKMTVYAMCAK
jgi:hypothetical protein